MEISPEEKKELMTLIGNNVRQCRLKRGIAQKELANQIDVDPSTITRIEGGTRMMSIPLLRTVAKALQVSYDTLLQPNDTDSSFANIQVKLATQSPENLAHLERIIHTVIDEYGAMET